MGQGTDGAGSGARGLVRTGGRAASPRSPASRLGDPAAGLAAGWLLAACCREAMQVSPFRKLDLHATGVCHW